MHGLGIGSLPAILSPYFWQYMCPSYFYVYYLHSIAFKIKMSFPSNDFVYVLVKWVKWDLRLKFLNRPCALSQQEPGLYLCLDSHLSKRPSDLILNGTQEKTPFSGTVFDILSRGVVRFVASNSSKTTFWPVEIFWQPIRSFYSMAFEATTRNKMNHNMWNGMENCARKWCLFLCTI